MKWRVFVAMLSCAVYMSANAETITSGRYTRESGSGSFQLYENGSTVTYSDEDTIFKCDRASERVFVCVPWEGEPFAIRYVDDHTVETWQASNPDSPHRRWITDARPPAPPSDPVVAARLEMEKQQKEVDSLRERNLEKAEEQRRIEAEQQQQEQFAQYEANREAAHEQFEAEARQRERDLQDSIQRLRDSTARYESIAREISSRPDGGKSQVSAAEVANARAATDRQQEIGRQFDAAHPATTTGHVEIEARDGVPAAATAQTANTSPALSPNEHLMGFLGETCEAARQSAQRWVGAGGSFSVAHERPDGRMCLVQIDLDSVVHGTGKASSQ